MGGFLLKFEQLLSEKGIQLTHQQTEQFNLYFEQLIDWNEKINLTAITEKNEVFLKHFYDSITPCFIFDFSNQLSICDVGAGAGFPSIPLKILFPHLHISIVDSLNKRISFLDALTKELGFKDVELYHDRAETFGQNAKFREHFDVVTARAVARLNVLSEFCLPLAKRGGHFIALKGAIGEEEVKESQKAIKVLGGEIQSIENLTLPEEESQRQLIVIKKINLTPKKYPRKPGMPSKQPL